MKPFLHARISARVFGGHWSDTLPIHDLIDSSKAAHPTMRHRAVFHSDLGVSIVEAVFAATQKTCPKSLPPTKTVAIQHIEDDLGRVPSVAEWASCLHLPDAALRPPKRLGTTAFREDPAAAAAAKWGGSADAYRSLIEWFDEPERQTGDRRAAFILQNSFGLFLSERVFGPVIEVAKRRYVPVRDIGEALLLARHGTIPSLDSVLRCLELKSWMYPEPSGRLHDEVSAALRRRRAHNADLKHSSATRIA